MFVLGSFSSYANRPDVFCRANWRRIRLAMNPFNYFRCAGHDNIGLDLVGPNLTGQIDPDRYRWLRSTGSLSLGAPVHGEGGLMVAPTMLRAVPWPCPKSLRRIK